MMNVQFARVSESNLKVVPERDGTIIFTKDTGTIYYDVVESDGKIIRQTASSFVPVENINDIAAGVKGKLYYSAHDKSFYVWEADAQLQNAHFEKVHSIQAKDIPIDVDGIEAKNLSDAIVELLCDIDTKIDKDISDFIVTNVDMSGNNDGIKFTYSTVTPEGVQSKSITSNISLDEMGAASKIDFEKLAKLIDTKADQSYVSTKLDEKVDKTIADGPVTKSVELSGNKDGGIDYTIQLVDLADGPIADKSTGTLTAKDMGIATASQLTSIEAQVKSIRGGILRYAVDFAAQGWADIQPGDDMPAGFQEMVTNWLLGIGVTPYVGTAITNTNKDMYTYSRVFTFYIDETQPVPDPDEDGNINYALKLVDDGPDNVPTASESTLGIIRAGKSGDIAVDTNGDVTIKSKSITKAKLASDVTDEIDSKVNNTQKVNGIELKGNIDIKASDISYDDTSDIKTAVELKFAEEEKAVNEALDNKMPTRPTAQSSNIAVFDNDGNVIDSNHNINELDNFVEKVKDATDGHIALLGADGSIYDSGKSILDLTPKWIDWDEETDTEN
jgi:hypothetical protein